MTLLCPPNKRRVSPGSALELLFNSIKFSPFGCSIIVQLTPFWCTYLSLWSLNMIYRILSCLQITERKEIKNSKYVTEQQVMLCGWKGDF